jgi:hydroxyacylglutathione hydrolase
MKRMNRAGAPVLGRLPEPSLLHPSGLAAKRQAGALQVDTPPTAAFGAGHLPGAINVPLGRSFTTYAGSVLPYDRDLAFLLASPTPGKVADLVAGCVSIGLDRLAGVAGPESLMAWQRDGKALGTVARVTAQELLAQADGRILVDVRNGSEWEAGHARGAMLVPLAELADRLGDIPAQAGVVVMCQGGSRSAVAASVLQAAGREPVQNLAGGFADWVSAGGIVDRDA